MNHGSHRPLFRTVSKPYELRYFSRPGRRGDWHSRGWAYDRLDLAEARCAQLNRELSPYRKASGGHWEIVTFKAELSREITMKQMTKEGGYYAS